MPSQKSKLVVKKPHSFWTKPLQADFKQLFKALAAGIGNTATGKWEEIGTNAIEALSSIGLTTDVQELAFLLVRRSLTRAMFDLVGEITPLLLSDSRVDRAALCDQLDTSMLDHGVQLDRAFLDRPGDIALIQHIPPVLTAWLKANGLSDEAAASIVSRFPAYFVYAINEEWRSNSKAYRPIAEALDTPFTLAGEREWSWMNYSALLQRRTTEGIFDEPFSLSQLYVPLNAYFNEEVSHKSPHARLPDGDRSLRRCVVALEDELLDWLGKTDAEDVVRVLSGGPGSGKSCFARMFVAKVCRTTKTRALYIPLHLIDATKDLVEEVGRFVRDEGVLVQNPLDPQTIERSLLIVFDGLDELSSQGKASAETARAFVREVERTVEKRNLNGIRLRVILSGRELVVQENESEFRRPRQVLNLLPYCLPRDAARTRHVAGPEFEEQYHDPLKLLEKDLRNEWWSKYGKLTGHAFDGLPQELKRADLEEVTGQPLLNYLVALSFTRGALDFGKGVNLNAVYQDLVEAVHDRGYEKHRRYAPIKHMTLDSFERVLEEIGLAAWHGDGRTTTVREIEEHCKNSGVASLLEAFQEGAKAGVTKLLAAFFFRQYGRRPSGDPTFVFTHKSFGEYLTSRRVVRAVDRIVRELERRCGNPDEGWDERDALKHWTQVCGPSAITPYLHNFLLAELRLKDALAVDRWQDSLTRLFSYMLQNGLPIEQLHVTPFRHAVFQSRNAEEALLVLLNGCALITERICDIQHPSPTAFWTWFKRMQGQRQGGESCMAASCLSYLNLSRTIFYIADLYAANLYGSNLSECKGALSCMYHADLENTVCNGAMLYGANLTGANLKGADLTGVEFTEALIDGANFNGAKLQKAYARRDNDQRAVSFSRLLSQRKRRKLHGREPGTK